MHESKRKFSIRLKPYNSYSIKKIFYCDFDMAKGSVQKFEASSIKGGYLIDLEVKLAKL